ncbi:hypothetical protein ACN27F_05530 [Solwaraspora sp. WMMB335]|uniref:hypothetical protein n=1 Tax=Solwaraspora sp. WMMB335 TaxID=3404118 RepID=UPI003B941D80
MVSKMIKRYAVAAVAVPLAAAGVRKLGSLVESRRGPSSRTSKLLRRAGDMLHQNRRRTWR